MHIEDFEESGSRTIREQDVRLVDQDNDDEEISISLNGNGRNTDKIAAWDTKRAFVGAGARLLFYPTLLYNVIRNKFEPEFRWWDRVDEFVLLGAVPFPSDVLRLKELGVCGVITLNEPYETLVPTSLYHAHDIDHLVIPTRDYLFAPSLSNICQAVDFLHRNASRGCTTYVHCKAGRGRSTTIVLCYLVQHKHMTPYAAYDHVRSIRPRILLAPSQWQAVVEYYHLKVKNYSPGANLVVRSSGFPAVESVLFDDCSVVVITKTDLDGYDKSHDTSAEGAEVWADLSVIYRVRVAGQAALAKLSCLWLRCHSQHKLVGNHLHRNGSCTILANQIGGLSVDIHVY